MYSGNDADVTTFGVGATFVTSTDVSDEAVHTVVKSVMDNIEEVKKQHSAFANLDPKEMETVGLSARLHDHPNAASNKNISNSRTSVGLGYGHKDIGKSCLNGRGTSKLCCLV